MTISPEVRAGSTVEIDAGIVSENVESSSGQSSHHATIVVNAYNVYMPMIGGTR
jgi:hypothetical protein